jgi:hypothetical protein
MPLFGGKMYYVLTSKLIRFVIWESCPNDSRASSTKGANPW